MGEMGEMGEMGKMGKMGEMREMREMGEMLHEYMMSLTPEQQEQIGEIGDAIASSLDSLEVAYERMQTSLDVSDVIEQELLEQSESGFIQYQRYYDLFHFAPDACLLTDTKGLILEANQAAAMLLNVPHHYLMGKPLVVYVPAVERHLVELHGGTIHATSPGVGQGTTFKVKLPLIDKPINT